MATFTQIGSAVTVGAGGAASIDFTSIPSTYTDLVIKLNARTNMGATYTNVLISFNGSTPGFSNRELYGTGSSVGTGSGTGAGAGQGIVYVNAASATASTFGNAEIYITNYLSNAAKSFSGDSVVENNATLGLATLKAGLWNPATQAAITSITLTPDSSNFVQYSTAYLYGVSNA